MAILFNFFAKLQIFKRILNKYNKVIVNIYCYVLLFFPTELLMLLFAREGSKRLLRLFFSGLYSTAFIGNLLDRKKGNQKKKIKFLKFILY